MPYDANGNQTTHVVGGQTFTLGYDAENRLVSVSGAATASFTYDGDGRQVKAVIGGTTTYYVVLTIKWTMALSPNITLPERRESPCARMEPCPICCLTIWGQRV